MYMRTIVGKVSPSERDEIQALFERRNGLEELSRLLTPENEALYEKLVRDMGQTSIRFQGWWDRMSAKYGWQSSPTGRWEINFETCEITLVS